MNTRKTFTIIGLLLAVAFILPLVRASEADQAIQVTFSQAVQIPGKTLPAGTYWFVLGNEPNRDLVQVFNEDRSELLDRLITIPTERPKSTDHLTFTFANQGQGQPQAVVSWFYPGRTLGHEFVYPAPQKTEIAQSQHVTVVASGD